MVRKAGESVGYNEFFTGKVTHKSTHDIPTKSIPSQAITLNEYLANGGVPLVGNKPPDIPEEFLALDEPQLETDSLPDVAESSPLGEVVLGISAELDTKA